jgi:hypothetical protein
MSRADGPKVCRHMYWGKVPGRPYVGNPAPPPDDRPECELSGGPKVPGTAGRNDQEIVSPFACIPGRACYEAPEE